MIGPNTQAHLAAAIQAFSAGVELLGAKERIKALEEKLAWAEQERNDLLEAITQMPTDDSGVEGGEG